MFLWALEALQTVDNAKISVLKMMDMLIQITIKYHLIVAYECYALFAFFRAALEFKK